MGAMHVDVGKETKTCWNLWRTFEALSRRGRSISFELGMSHGFIILALKKNEWACNTGTLHLLARKNSKQCHLPARFFWLFFGTHREFTWQFLEAGNSVNSAWYIETIKNLCRRVCRVRRSASPILLLHDNARLHTACSTIDALEMLKFEVLSQPPYSPDLAPSDFHFFSHLKRDLKGTHFTSDDEVKRAVTLRWDIPVVWYKYHKMK